MDPITGGLAVIGLGMSIFGGTSAASESRRQAQLQQQVAGQETLLNAQRRQQMEMSNRRSQLENVRNVQRAKAMGLVTATSQGAQFGSGFEGGQAQIQGQGNYNALGLSQALQSGETSFDINDRITNLRSQITSSQSSQATDQGLASLGGSIFGASTTLGKLGQGVSLGNPFSDPLSGFGGSSRWSISG